MSYDATTISEEEEGVLDEEGEMITVDATELLAAALTARSAAAASASANHAAAASAPAVPASSSSTSAAASAAGGNALRPMAPLAMQPPAAATTAAASTKPAALNSAPPLGGLSPDPADESGMAGGLGLSSASAAAPSSLFSLLGVLNNYRMRIRSPTLDHLFGKINVDKRSWDLLLRSQLPANELAVGMEQLLDTVTEFVKRLNRKSSTCVPTILDNVLYTEEVNFAYRVYSRSHAMSAQVQRCLRPMQAGIEKYLESERGALPVVDLKQACADRAVRARVERIFSRIDEALSEDGRGADSAATSQRGSASNSNRSSINVGASSGGGAGGGGTHSARGSIAGPGLGVFLSRSRNASRRGSRKPSSGDGSAFASGCSAGAGGASHPSSRQPSFSENLLLRQGSRGASDAAGAGVGSVEKLHSVADSPEFGPAIALDPSKQHASVAGAAASSAVQHSPPAARRGISRAGSTDTTTTSRTAPASPAHAHARDAEEPQTQTQAQVEEQDGDSGEDSEEEPESQSGAQEDIFAKLLNASDTHRYPLPARLRPQKQGGAGVGAPLQDSFLSNYLPQHCKSFRLAEALLDSYAECLLSQYVALALSETLHKADWHAALQADSNMLASDLVRLGLPLLAKLLDLEPTFLAENLLALSFAGVELGQVYSDARQLVRKARLLHALFAALDIFVFPRSIPAHGSGCKAIAVAHTDAHFVCTGGYDRAMRIWDLRPAGAGGGGPGTGGGTGGGGKCLAQFIGHESVVTWCAFSQTDAWLASSSMDGTVRLWNARSGECTRVLRGHADGILDAELGSKDKYVATASMDCTVRLWAVATGKCLRVYRGHRHWVKTVRFASDAQSLVSAGLDHAIFVWALRSAGGAGGSGGGGGGGGGAPRHVLLQHTAPVLDVSVLSGARFVSTSKDRTLRVWDSRTGKAELCLSNPAGVVALSLSLSPDLSLLAGAFFDNTISVWDVREQQASCPLRRQIKVHNDGILCVRWINQRTLVIGTSTGKLQILHI